ncbi:beta-galactosidase [Paenarthrobacter sp. AB444]|uniref:beta-galactosidase n=1 Tax=Paenarthrobacter sp. AB444 TaxID=3025681 RepID=UPI002365ECE4|nr:beta-galactosidase [Paenarthrobacter sp. AB444]MDD7833899.1 beta-galactosidase [Paenarthrobacter sp. AB444]
MATKPTFSGILFGAAYYAEYQPQGTLERDLDLMRKAGFNVIRVGESVWSTWEPREGVFELDWLEPVLDGAYERGIGVILGTPTYAIPPWLQRLHPEIAAERRTGTRNGWGARQEMDQSEPAYRYYAERVVRKVIARYANHPAVIGFQVDNEPGFQLPHNEQTFQRFIEWLKDRYRTVENLNEQWGLVYWSHRLSDWADLWRPDANTVPQYQLEWRRFQATLATELIAWQTAIVREYANPDQFITTCLSYSRSQVSDDEIVQPLDVVAGNPYYKMQDGLEHGVEVPRPELWWSTGIWALFEWGDRAYSSAQSQFLVTETNAQSVGDPWQNHPPYPGQIKQAAFALLARGARMIEYWHWHTLHFGAETYWGGVLPHSQEPGRIYHEVAELGASLEKIGTTLDNYVPDANVAMLYSTDTKWSYEAYPPLPAPEGGPDRRAYEKIFDAFYRGLFDAGAQVRIHHVRQFLDTPLNDFLARFPILVVPALYVVDDVTLKWLKEYAAAGGHLVTGVRSGYGDHLARARMEVAPPLMTDAAGLTYDEYSNLDRELLVQGAGRFDLEEGSAGIDWVDILKVGSASTLVTFDHNELGAHAAITTNSYGKGRVTYVATVPNPALGRSLGRWLVPDNARRRWAADPAVTISTGTTDKSTLTFVSNWSAESAEITAPFSVRHLESGAEYKAGSLVTLEPRSTLLFEAAHTNQLAHSPSQPTERNHENT